ncbi:MAG: hybrid sensor histidine kinase/response regulator [Candidatus Dadabacteria bacterium]|nr:MAG: hybrid sensor histidine kinase/response regulator [Candidatus Dadabacteria bacterium]
MNDKLQKRLRQAFAAELKQHLNSLRSLAMSVQSGLEDVDAEAITNAYRAAHSLKGAARAVQEDRIVEIATRIEDTLSPVRSGEPFDAEAQADFTALLDALIEAAEAGRDDAREREAPESPVPEPAAAERPVQGGDAAVSVGAQVTPAATEPDVGIDSVRTIRIDERLVQSIAESQEQLTAAVLNARRLHGQYGARELGDLADTLQRVAQQLRSAVSSLFRTPVAELTPILKEVVWSAARIAGRKVRFEIEGEHLDIDRGVAEALVEVATHLLRNAIDHGIEPPDERSRAGKPEVGQLWLKLRQTADGGYDVEIADDGRGIDVDAIRSRVGDADGAFDLFDALCRPGLSTADRVSELSGRGLGMNIVRERVRALGGTVDLETNRSKGTRFRIHFPATLREAEVLVATSGGIQFAVPASAIVRVLDAKTAVAADGTIAVSGGRHLVIHPGALLGDAVLEDDDRYCLVLRAGERLAGVVVSELQLLDVLPVAPAARPLASHELVTGLVGNGARFDIPLLKPEAIISRASSGATRARRSDADRGPIRVLVAEDSLTSRIFLESMLEQAGYDVIAVEDGQQALRILQTEGVDVVVSDIEMPNLDGFELTAAIRSQDAWSRLPVILVTSLASDEHRRRGVDVGADAYIVKGEFEQGTLLDAIRRFAGRASTS